MTAVIWMGQNMMKPFTEILLLQSTWVKAWKLSIIRIPYQPTSKKPVPWGLVLWSQMQGSWGYDNHWRKNSTRFEPCVEPFQIQLSFFRMMHIWWYHFAVGEYSQMADGLYFAGTRDLRCHLFCWLDFKQANQENAWHMCDTWGISVCQCFFFAFQVFFF